MVRGKKGWIRIVEAFVAVLIVAGALLIVLDQQSVNKSDFSQEVYEQQIKVLREIEIDDSSRDAILDHDISLGGVPAQIEGQLKTRLPASLSCDSKICTLNEVCAQEDYREENVYAASIAIAANDEKYSPRQLKLFCWVK